MIFDLKEYRFVFRTFPFSRKQVKKNRVRSDTKSLQHLHISTITIIMGNKERLITCGETKIKKILEFSVGLNDIRKPIKYR